MRQPCVAGRFYDDDPEKLTTMVDACIALGTEKSEAKTLLAMVPHAGYVFSGGVCGKTLAQANLESTILLLGPNHTGFGARFALWPNEDWAIPGGSVPIDTELAEVLLAADAEISADTMAHVREHSLEVILPFLQRINPATTIVPIAISASMFEDLERVGKAIGRALKAFDRPVSIVVSSDMSHYVTQDDAKQLDSMALEPALKLDPAGLFKTVRENEISMCGVRPMAVGLVAALEMGATMSELVAYTTSGEVSGDFEQVVGYAGMLVS